LGTCLHILELLMKRNGGKWNKNGGKIEKKNSHQTKIWICEKSMRINLSFLSLLSLHCNTHNKLHLKGRSFDFIWEGEWLFNWFLFSTQLNSKVWNSTFINSNIWQSLCFEFE
jgi:hypothetical protein